MDVSPGVAALPARDARPRGLLDSSRTVPGDESATDFPLPADSAPETSAFVSIFPPPPPGNPEYLVRTLLFIPDDRWPATPAEFEAKAEAVRQRLDIFYKFVGDYFRNEFRIQGIYEKAPNFERDELGRVVVHFFHGKEDHRWYWGDWDHDGVRGGPGDVAKSGLGVDGNCFMEAFGGHGDNLAEECRRSVVCVLSDCGEYCPATPPHSYYPGWAGLVGFGGQMEFGSLGWGGYFHASAIFLDYLPTRYGNAAWQQAICDNSFGHTQTGGLPVYFGSALIPPGALLSSQIGTYIHELGHGLGLLHMQYNPELDPAGPVMWVGWQWGDHAVRRTYNLPACDTGANVPIDGAELRWSETVRLSPSKYLNNWAWSDTDDPRVIVAWPRLGTLFDPTQASPYLIMTGVDWGSGLNNMTLSRDWNMYSTPFPTRNFDYVRIDDTALRGEVLFPPGQATVTLQLQGMDNEGNMGYSGMLSTRWLVRWPQNDGKPGGFVYVDPDGSDDDSNTTEGMPVNPFQDIQSAIDASGPTTAAVVILPGVYTLSSPLRVKNGLSLLGWGKADRIILEGTDSMVNLVEFQGGKNVTLANMTLRNAFRGIVSMGTQPCVDFMFGNLIFHNLRSGGIDLNVVDGVRVENCTFYNIRYWGLRFNYDGDDPLRAAHSRATNNIFDTCGAGIIVGGDDRFKDPYGGYIAYNLFNKCITDLTCDGAPQVASRYTGTIELEPYFHHAPGGDFRLRGFSPAVWSGDPLMRDSGGDKPRSRGALEYEGAEQSIYPAIVLDALLGRRATHESMDSDQDLEIGIADYLNFFAI